MNRLLEQVAQSAGTVGQAYRQMTAALVTVHQGSHNLHQVLEVLQDLEPRFRDYPVLQARLYNNILFISSLLGDRTRAETALQRMSLLAVQHAQYPEMRWWWVHAVLNMARLASMELRHREAIAWFRACLVMLEGVDLPDRDMWRASVMAEALSHLAYHLAAVGDFDQAVAAIRRAQEWSPCHSAQGQALVDYHSAEVAWAAGDLRAAVHYLIRARRRDPRFYLVRALVSWLAARMVWVAGKQTKALARIERGRRYARLAGNTTLVRRFDEMEAFIRARPACDEAGCN